MKTYLISLLILLTSWGTFELLERSEPVATETTPTAALPLDAAMTFCHPIAGDMRALFNDPEFWHCTPARSPRSLPTREHGSVSLRRGARPKGIT
ncbi:hypothetical protein A3SI_02341 [Nitritalea halalkaliphila LW7]|uniref:Uncharacterized protein n=1 Tax=Nitritalea halalkaliphila LW7 TaxID=1189621 RepID=I5C9R2_9BACT|nr:hypothetical protein [Nitritalea halalkaliphila]EIM78564.1 hypothetical protein A3SI_02341 [Nitritalea halalkaliphila LW7]